MPQQEPRPQRKSLAIGLVVLGLALAVAVIGVRSMQSRTEGGAALPAAVTASAQSEQTSQPAETGQPAEPVPGEATEASAEPAMPQPDRPAALVPMVSAGEIAANPTLYYGRSVSVHAEIEDVLDGRSFTLDEDRLGASPDVLVLLPEPAGAVTPTAGSMVVVVGQVEPFVESRLTDMFDWLTPSPDVLLRIRARPVVIAESVRTASGMSIMDREGPPPVLVTNPGRIADTPAPFYGVRVLLPDATVDTVTSARAFTLDDPAFLLEDDLLVLLPPHDGGRAIRPDETVTVRGTVRRFVADQFARDYEWFKAGEMGDLSAWAGRPVLVADLIRPEGGSDVALIGVAWTSPTRLDGSDWWLARTWEPLPAADALAKPAPVAAAGATATPIRSLQALLDAGERALMAGRVIELSSTTVQQIVGDAILLVGPSADRTVAIRLSEDLEVSAGEMVSVSGSIRRVPESLDGWQLDDAGRRELGGRQVFVEASEVARTDASGR